MENENTINQVDTISQLDAIDSALNELEANIDNVSTTEDNSGNGTANDKAEEVPSIDALTDTIRAQSAQIDRLTAQMSKMVMFYGARINNSENKIEQQKSMKVEQTFDDGINVTDIPLLDDIKLGS